MLFKTRCCFVLFLTLLVGTIDANAIINGRDVDIQSNDLARHLVGLHSIEHQANGDLVYHKGSAVIIEKNLLLTAGHNAFYMKSPSDIEAIFSAKPCWGPNICNEVRIKSKHFAFYPKFAQPEGGTRFDLALVELDSAIPDNFEPVSYSSSPVDLLGQSIQVLGYGDDRDIGDPAVSSNRLRVITMPVATQSYMLGSSDQFWWDQHSGGFCSGDSGGPAILNMNGKDIVIGIAVHVTYTDGVGHCLTRGAFSDVLYFKDWVERTKSDWNIQ